MDLRTHYLGFELPHPFMIGASPLADTLDTVRQMEDAGAAAIVMRSLFQEQIDVEAMATHLSTELPAESFGEAVTYFADPQDFVVGPEEYLETLSRLKEAVAIPIIASLNGYTRGGWLDYSKAMEQAGADAVELNLYDIPINASQSAGDIEGHSVEMVREVAKAVKIPLAVKLSPFYTSLPHFARRLEEAGAQGLVLFNRFFEADIDIEELEIRSHLQLSDSRELLLRLRWLAILSGSLEETTFAVTGGVHTAVDGIKAVMSGANAIQMVSAVLRNGPDALSKVRGQMAEWMEEKEYHSLEQMRGSMNIKRCPDPRALSRANYMRQIMTWQD